MTKTNRTKTDNASSGNRPWDPAWRRKSELTGADTCRYKEAAIILKLPVSTLYSLVRRKQIPHFRLGPRTVRFSRREIAGWLAQSRVAPANEPPPPPPPQAPPAPRSSNAWRPESREAQVEARRLDDERQNAAAAAAAALAPATVVRVPNTAFVDALRRKKDEEKPR
jgi:excisionase family DNA binding protein